jgi:hypothetical protein
MKNNQRTVKFNSTQVALDKIRISFKKEIQEPPIAPKGINKNRVSFIGI